MYKIIVNIETVFLTVLTRPDLKDLVEFVTPDYAVHWKTIGLLIGIPVGEIQAIEYGQSTMPQVCCNEMFIKWLELDTHASWGKIFTAIDSPAVCPEEHPLPNNSKLHHQN